MNMIQALTGNSEAKRGALEVQRIAISQFNAMLNAWQTSMDKIWQCADPPATVAELGNTAAEMFSLSAKTCAFLEQLSPGCTAERLRLMAAWQITTNPDGTVTVVPQPSADEPGDGEPASDSLT